MKLRILLKTSLMLGLVIVGRLARDVEQTNPGRSLDQIIKLEAAARTSPDAIVRAAPLPTVVAPKVKAVPPRHMATQAASLSSMAELD